MSSLDCKLATTGTDGEVANALVCKTSIHGFKSHSVLHIFIASTLCEYSEIHSYGLIAMANSRCSSPVLKS